MLKTYPFAVFLMTMLVITSCGNTATDETNNSGNTNSTVSTPPPAEVLYQSISLDRLEYLWNNATYMDVVFYELPVSLNQSELEQIRSTLVGIGEGAPTINPACKSIGRIFFQVGGENIETAEIYFNEGCTYYVWLENDQPAYANEMTPAALSFYNNIFQQVQQANQQFQNQ